GADEVVAMRARRISLCPTEDGAFMEARGCSRWQSVANRSAQGRPRKQAKTVAVDCDRLPEGAHGRRESTAGVRERALRSTRVAAFPLRLSREEIVDRRVDRPVQVFLAAQHAAEHVDVAAEQDAGLAPLGVWQ